MVAEELFFGEASTGVAGDLQAATTERLPDGRTAGHGHHPDLVGGRSSTRPAGSSPRCWPTDDGRAEVEDLLATAKASVAGMLDEHRDVVEALRDALLEREELIGDEILEVIRSVPAAAAAAAAATPAPVVSFRLGPPVVRRPTVARLIRPGQGPPVGAMPFRLHTFGGSILPVRSRRSGWGVLGTGAAAAAEDDLHRVDRHAEPLSRRQRQAADPERLDVEHEPASLTEQVMVLGPTFGS